ncbi:MAG: nitroreductase family protein [Nanoarchaeota archaeon]
MNVDTAIRGRRSCHSYQQKDVPLDVLGELLEAGTCAPSAGNLQSWHFLVVRDASKREKLAAMSHDQTWMNEAPVYIVVCNDRDEMMRWFGEEGVLYGSQNCAVAAGLIMIKAESLGLGTCWVGGFDVDKVQELLDIPGHIIPEIIITVGYPNRLEKDDERRSLHDVISFEKFGGKADLKWIPLNKQVKKLAQKKDEVIKKGKETLKGLE